MVKVNGEIVYTGDYASCLAKYDSVWYSSSKMLADVSSLEYIDERNAS